MNRIMMEGIFLLLGSNLGDKKTVLEHARVRIAENIGPIIQCSSIYETAAWGKTDQPSFFNQVIEVATELPAHDILQRINAIEQALGRIRKEKWGARIIDIDILYYKNQIIESDHLTIPHPGIPERRFTLVPLAEIAPDYVHPVLKKTNLQLLQDCKDELKVREI